MRHDEETVDCFRMQRCKDARRKEQSDYKELDGDDVKELWFSRTCGFGGSAARGVEGQTKIENFNPIRVSPDPKHHKPYGTITTT